MLRKSIALLLVGLSVLSVLGVSAAGAAAPPKEGSVEATGGDHGDLSARNVRETFGLDASEEAIAAAGAQGERLGIEVTAAEADRIDRQLALEAQLGQARGEVRAALGTQFGAVWVDRATGAVVVTTTGHPDQAQAAVAAALPGVEVLARVVERSDDDLHELSQRVATDELSPAGTLGVTAVGREPMAGQVVVDVSGDLEKAAAALAERYGDGVVARPAGDAQFLSRTASPLWKPGKELTSPAYAPGGICTGAYGVQRGSTKYVTTAGHCADGMAMGTSFTVGTSALGTLAERHWQPVTDADVALIEVTSPLWQLLPGANCVYLTATSCSTVLEYRDPGIGDTVCFSGARTNGTYCGTVTLERDVFSTGAFAFLFDMVEATGFPPRAPCSGDSGSPIYTPAPGGTGVIARGVLSYRIAGGNCAVDATGNVGFSRWSNVQGALGVQGGCNGSWVDSGTCPAGTYSDVPYQHRFYQEIDWASDTGLTTGYEDGTFKPTQGVTRQAGMAWLWRMAGSPTGYTTQQFTDVPPSHAFFQAINWAKVTGVSTGYTTGCPTGNPCFKPNDNLTRQAWAAFLYRQEGEPYAGTPANQVYQPMGGVCQVTTTHEFFKAILWNVNQRVMRATPFVTAPADGCASTWGFSQNFNPVGVLDRQTAMVSAYNLSH